MAHTRPIALGSRIYAGLFTRPIETALTMAKGFPMGFPMIRMRSAWLPRAASIACLVGCSSSSGGPAPVDAVATCGSLSTFDQGNVGCLNVQNALLGEVFAIPADGSQAPTPVGAFANTMPATASELAMAPASCVSVLMSPVTTGPAGVTFAHSYNLDPFRAQLSATYEGFTAELNAKIAADDFAIDVGQLEIAELNDPSRLLSCSALALQAVGDYWMSRTPAEQANTVLFFVDKVVSTNSLSVTSSSGTSVGASASYTCPGMSGGASVTFSVTFECNEIIGLPPDSGFTPTFFDGQVFTFDPATSTVQFGQAPNVNCTALE
jgi:hypothetical protein